MCYSNVCYVPYEEERVDGERRVADRLKQEVPLCHCSQRLVFCNRSSRVSGRYVELGRHVYTAICTKVTLM
jgi:hypothetical protein